MPSWEEVQEVLLQKDGATIFSSLAQTSFNICYSPSFKVGLLELTPDARVSGCLWVYLGVSEREVAKSAR